MTGTGHVSATFGQRGAPSNVASSEATPIPHALTGIGDGGPTGPTVATQGAPDRTYSFL